MKAIIPAAGYASRLYPRTLNVPKSLLKINGRPIIEHVVNKISELSDINDIIIITNNKFYHTFFNWSLKFNCKKRLKVINDYTEKLEDRLGTIGDLNYALNKENITEDFLVINADNLFNFKLSASYSYFRDKDSNVISLYDVKDLETAKRLGSPKIDGLGKIINFIEKDPNVKSTLCSIGIYFFKKEIRNEIEDYLDNGNSPDKSGEFIKWLYQKKDVYGFIINHGVWFDIGTADSYRMACDSYINI